LKNYLRRQYLKVREIILNFLVYSFEFLEERLWKTKSESQIRCPELYEEFKILYDLNMLSS